MSGCAVAVDRLDRLLAIGHEREAPYRINLPLFLDANTCHLPLPGQHKTARQDVKTGGNRSCFLAWDTSWPLITEIAR